VRYGGIAETMPEDDGAMRTGGSGALEAANATDEPQAEAHATMATHSEELRRA